jgi:hypothetical protein
MIIAQITNVLLSLAGVAAVIICIVMWFVSLIQSIIREDLKNHRALWILLIIFVSPIGSIVYFFMENRKKYGWIHLGAVIALPVILSAYAIVSYIAVLQ